MVSKLNIPFFAFKEVESQNGGFLVGGQTTGEDRENAGGRVSLIPNP
jgi:hypothetical protein